MEVMGLHLPGASFIQPNTPLRDALTAAAARQITRLTETGINCIDGNHIDVNHINSSHINSSYLPVGQLVDEKVVVNGIVALLATGGSTNHTLHLVAMARAAGIIINWDDFSELSEAVPQLCRIYPNGPADINYFQASGGVALLVNMLLQGGLLHEEVHTVAGFGLQRYTQEPYLAAGKLQWRPGPQQSLDATVIASLEQPFSAQGGTKVLNGNLGAGGNENLGSATGASGY